MNESLEKQLDSLFLPWNNQNGPGIQILIRKNGRTLYEKCFGLASLEHRIPVTPETVFHVASVSKQFTVLALLLLWKEGRLDLEDDIRVHVPELISFDEPVTLRQLMNNVSGLRDQWELLFMRGIRISDSIGMEDINTSIRMQKHLNFPPRSAYLYSNTGFHLLSLTVERCSGLPFPEFARKRIFEPLGMKRTRVRASTGEIIPGLAYSYQDPGTGFYSYDPLNYSLYGPTSVNTCARDLVRMLSEYIHPRVFDREILSVMMTPAVLSDGTVSEYCGGLMTHRLGGRGIFEHGGADAAYRSHVFCIPQEELELVLLSNTNSRLMSKTARKAACLILGLPNDTEPALPDAVFSAPEEGVYLSSHPDDPQIVRVLKKQDDYFMERETGITKLSSCPDGSFRVGTLDERLCFLEDSLLFRLPSSVITLKPAAPVRPGRLMPGIYRQEETSMEFAIRETADGCSLSTLRYGTVPVYESTGGSMAFLLSPDFAMYIRQDGQELVLDGGRVRNMRCRRL